MLAILLCLTLGDFGGECQSVVDGDTIWVVSDAGDKVKVRLHGIDAPERRQPHGYEATVSLASMCLHKRVNVIERGMDQNGRIVAIVLCDGIDIGMEQVVLGQAWQDPRYSKCKLTARYQESAKLLNRGLWAKPDPVEPWKWRKGRR